MRIVLIINQVSSKLVFISRNCTDFNNPKALKSLYCSFIFSVLKYNSVICSPYMSGLAESIKAIQNLFLRFFAFKCGIQHQKYSCYSLLSSITNLETLEVRRIKSGLCSIYKLLNGDIHG